MISIGDRISIRGDRGTIRYVGRLESGDEQVWAGIEWDNPVRGKHSGTYNGRHVFSTKQDSSGSFIKIEKLQKGDKTISLIGAIEKKYLDEEQDSSVMTVVGISKQIEKVGFNKIRQRQRNLELARELSVSNCAVSYEDLPGALLALIPST